MGLCLNDFFFHLDCSGIKINLSTGKRQRIPEINEFQHDLAFIQNVEKYHFWYSEGASGLLILEWFLQPHKLSRFYYHDIYIIKMLNAFNLWTII